LLRKSLLNHVIFVTPNNTFRCKFGHVDPSILNKLFSL
jgi:hypothetical protein